MPFLVKFHSANDIKHLSDNEQVFAIINHGQNNYIDSQHRSEIHIALPSLDKNQLEVWYSHQPAQYRQYGQIHYHITDDFIFGSLLINEAEFANLESATKYSYSQIRGLLQDTGFASLLRMWNFFPEINAQGSPGLERYKMFCMGRHSAISQWNILESQLPAASAIGCHNEGLLIIFLAAKQPGLQIENPRQISAFNYPQRYGPRSPSFSRATLKNWGESQHLYISGTASVVGHETRHINDYMAQLEETLTNIESVIQRAHTSHQLPCRRISDLDLMRIFVRKPVMCEAITERLAEKIDTEKIIITQGDICRSDLLLEIEGLYTHGY